MIWSDTALQNFSRNFVCVIEDVFYLQPHKSIRKVPDPESLRLFTTFVNSAPEQLWPKDTATYQGLYIMEPNGRYLSGGYAHQSNTHARSVLAHGWKAWSEKTSSINSKEVPLNYVPVVGGNPVNENELKLRISFRDLPRGENKRPGNAQFPNPYNIAWYDISKNQARLLFTGDGNQVFKKIALATMKDAVRGEMHSWKESDWQSGSFKAEHFKTENNMAYYYFSGHARMLRAQTGLSYSPKIFGFGVYDLGKNDFRELQLLACGQRTGTGISNGRKSDLGPAPMAVAIRMYHPGY